jgi:NAD(P)-dependent dehydrogenase (short-subunit alcohol dehydrogenase family)
LSCLLTGEDGLLVAAVRAALEAAGERVVWAPTAASRAEAEQAVAAAEAEAGPLTALVACPPTTAPVAFDELSPAVFDETQAVAFRSPFLFTQAALPRLRAAAHGRLVYVVSALGVSAEPRTAHVASAAQATIALMRTATLEVTAPLTANAIAVATGESPTPAEDVADSVLWLLRPQSDRLTGQVLTLPGATEPPA